MIRGINIKDKIWDSYEFYSLSESKQKKLLGAKIAVDYFGYGTAFLIKDRVMVKVYIKCKTRKHKRAIYLTDAFTTGDLGNVYDSRGIYQGNIGNDCFKVFCECK